MKEAVKYQAFPHFTLELLISLHDLPGSGSAPSRCQQRCWPQPQAEHCTWEGAGSICPNEMGSWLGSSGSYQDKYIKKKNNKIIQQYHEFSAF